MITTAPDEIARNASRGMHERDRASQQLGMEVTEIGPGRCEMRMTVTPDQLNGHGVCHGGLIFALADSAFAHACNSHGALTVATAAQIEFVNPARAGDDLAATACERWRGGRAGVYDVEVRHGDGTLIALFRGKSLTTGEGIGGGKVGGDANPGPKIT